MATCTRTAYGGGNNYHYYSAAAGDYNRLIHSRKHHHHHHHPNYKFRDRNSTTSRVWVPAIPKWERDFCRESNGIKWEDLLEAKKYSHLGTKVLEWDDLAGREAFLRAKTKYRAKLDGLPCASPSDPSPDLYTDADIDWNPKIDPDLFDGFESAHKEQIQEMKLDEKIVPTGWDCVDDENRLPEIVVCR